MNRFSLAIFLSAFLLFQVQPLTARYVLPWYGGGPAVWTSCMLFFQVFLLSGYAYAHWLASLTGPRKQAVVHISLIVVSLFFLPAVPHLQSWSVDLTKDPALRIILLLVSSVGIPYFVLSSTGPLFQSWFTRNSPQGSPWRLYSLSNAGSFLALLSYPLLVEPYTRLRTQSLVWSGLYVCFAILCALTALRAAPASQVETSSAETPPNWQTTLFWLGLSAAGSTVLLATTNQISQEIAVNPFLWVVPLAIYLLTFILTFESERWYQRSFFSIAAGIMAPVACAVLGATAIFSVPKQLAVYLLTLFIVCMLCQGELSRSRPSPGHLTMFYLVIAAGGAMGGVFVALGAPRLFTEYGEYPIGLGVACLLAFVGWMRTGAFAQWSTRNFAVRIPLMALLLGGITSIAALIANANHPGVERWRNFYGILRVSPYQDALGKMRLLTHGSIRHGLQYLTYPQSTWPTSYYGPHSGVAIVLNSFPPRRRVAVIGLGTGTMAAWGRPGDTFRFYEINPDVERVARTRFTYLRDSKAHVDVILGDARVQMAAELAAGHSHDFDLIAVDAFSSDSIPLHLLTNECANLYRARLAPGGALVLHISNRSLDLEPVARGMALHLGWKGGLFINPADEKVGESASNWVLLASDSALFERPSIAAEVFGWTLRNGPPITWTDDFASLWHVLRF